MRQLFQQLARYNTEANQRLYDACSTLTDAERKRCRAASFGSVHSMLNHVLKGDRIWLARFGGEDVPSTGLNVILYQDFSALGAARAVEDTRIEHFMHTALTEEFLVSTVSYVNNQGKCYTDLVPTLLSHFFNHQTHHRGQLHTLLRESGVRSLNLDLHRVLNP